MFTYALFIHEIYILKCVPVHYYFLPTVPSTSDLTPDLTSVKMYIHTLAYIPHLNGSLKVQTFIGKNKI